MLKVGVSSKQNYDDGRGNVALMRSARSWLMGNWNREAPPVPRMSYL
jgi:hypothetical protein